MLLAKVGFAIEDVVSKDLTNTLPVPEILILTCIFRGFGFFHFRKNTERGLVFKKHAKQNLPTSSFCRHAGVIIFLCVPLRLFLYLWPRQSFRLFLSLRNWGLRSGWVKVLDGAVGPKFAWGFLVYWL